MFRTQISLRSTLLALLLIVCPSGVHAQSGSTPLIWEARSDTNTVYLFGTIHVGARSLYPLSPEVQKAFSASRVLALEADPTNEQAALAAMSAGAYAPPDKLANHISPELMSRLEQRLPAIGLPLEFVNSMKPALLAITIAVVQIARQGYEPNLGVDIHLAQLAKQQSKRIIELESLEMQIALMNGFSPALQEGMLNAALEDVDTGELAKQVDNLVAAWRRGDAQHLLEQVDQDSAQLPAALAEEYMRTLYHDRNRQMGERIQAMLEGSDPTFVAVGTGHLLGPTGIVELLRGKGVRIRKL